MMGTETIAVLRYKLVQDPMRAGDPTAVVEDWSDPVRFTVSGVLVEPLVSEEPTRDARNQVHIGYRIYDVPAAAGVTSRDRVEVRGVPHLVKGEPQAWQLGSWRPGVVVTCERVDG